MKKVERVRVVTLEMMLEEWWWLMVVKEGEMGGICRCQKASSTDTLRHHEKIPLLLSFFYSFIYFHYFPFHKKASCNQTLIGS